MVLIFRFFIIYKSNAYELTRTHPYFTYTRECELQVAMLMNMILRYTSIQTHINTQHLHNTKVDWSRGMSHRVGAKSPFFMRSNMVACSADNSSNS